MATIPSSLRDEFAILKILVIAAIAGAVTWVFLAVAAGQISEVVTVIKTDGTIEVRTNTAVAVGITMFNAMAGGAIAFLFQEKAKRAQDATKPPGTP